MNAAMWLGLTFVAPFLIYLVARLIFAAFFFTKREYERRKNHE